MSSTPLWQQPALITFAVAWLVLLAERLIKLNDKHHPLTFCQLLFTRMAEKVNRRGRPKQQQLISGTLAFPVLMLPLLLILWILINMAEFPVFFDAVLLFIALRFEHHQRRARQVSQALLQGKKTLAKDRLNGLVLRDTASLSPMGISKAAIQSALLRFSYQQVAVLFWFFVGGGMLALYYRLMFEAAQCWNTKLSASHYFGAPISVLVNLCSWLPLQLSLWAGLIVGRLGRGLKALRNAPKSIPVNQRLLAGLGGILNVQLGGPAIYAGQKRRFAKVGGQNLPNGADIQQAIKLTKKQLMVLLGLSIITSAIQMAVQMKGL